MLLGVDHLAIAVVDPDAAVSELAALLGVPAGTSGGRHTAWGTRNRLLWLGDTYIELVTVFDARLAERSWLGRLTLGALGEPGSGPRAICWAISSDDIDLDRSEMNSSGASLEPAKDGERRRPDGRVVRWRLCLRREIDLGNPFLIEHDTDAAEWTPDDRAARAANPGRVAGLALPVPGIAGLQGATGGVAVGDQLVGLAGQGSNQPTIRVTGLERGDAVLDGLGCRWLVD